MRAALAYACRLVFAGVRARQYWSLKNTGKRMDCCDSPALLRIVCPIRKINSRLLLARSGRRALFSNLPLKRLNLDDFYGGNACFRKNLPLWLHNG